MLDITPSEANEDEEESGFRDLLPPSSKVSNGGSRKGESGGFEDYLE